MYRNHGKILMISQILRDFIVTSADPFTNWLVSMNDISPGNFCCTFWKRDWMDGDPEFDARSEMTRAQTTHAWNKRSRSAGVLVLKIINLHQAFGEAEPTGIELLNIYPYTPTN